MLLSVGDLESILDGVDLNWNHSHIWSVRIIDKSLACCVWGALADTTCSEDFLVFWVGLDWGYGEDRDFLTGWAFVWPLRMWFCISERFFEEKLQFPARQTNSSLNLSRWMTMSPHEREEEWKLLLWLLNLDFDTSWLQFSHFGIARVLSGLWTREITWMEIEIDLWNTPSSYIYWYIGLGIANNLMCAASFPDLVSVKFLWNTDSAL